VHRHQHHRADSTRASSRRSAHLFPVTAVLQCQRLQRRVSGSQPLQHRTLTLRHLRGHTSGQIALAQPCTVRCVYNNTLAYESCLIRE